MVDHFTQDLRFHPDFKKLKNVADSCSDHSPTSSPVKFQKTQDGLSSETLWFNYLLGKYEFYFEGFYPLLDVELKEDVQAALLKQSIKIAGFNIWHVEDRRLVRSITCLNRLYGIDQSEWNKEADIVASANCLLLERVRISIAKLIVTKENLMYAKIIIAWWYRTISEKMNQLLIKLPETSGSNSLQEQNQSQNSDLLCLIR